MKKNILLFIVSLSILAVSCHSQKTSSDAPANQPETAAADQNAANPEVQPEMIAAEDDTIQTESGRKDNDELKENGHDNVVNYGIMQCPVQKDNNNIIKNGKYCENGFEKDTDDGNCLVKQFLEDNNESNPEMNGRRIECKLKKEAMTKCVYKLYYSCSEGKEHHVYGEDDDGRYCEFAGELIAEDGDVTLVRCEQGDYDPQKGCICGNHTIEDIIAYDCYSKDDKYYDICMLSKGCQCGDSICPNSAACVDGQCIDPLTDKPINMITDAPSLGCHHGQNCTCGGNTCAEGEFCLNGQCQERIYIRIVHHKRINFLMNEVDTYQKSRPGSAASGNEAQFLVSPPLNSSSTWKRKLSDIWNKRRSCVDSFEGDEHQSRIVVPDSKLQVPEGYVVMPEIICRNTSDDPDCNGESAEIHIRCGREDGCLCGENTCPMGAECLQNKCKFDTQYVNFWCFDDYEPKVYSQHSGEAAELYESPYGKKNRLSFGVTVDSSGQCLCNGTMLKPGLGNRHSEMYSCTRFGWTCKLEDGCECGDVKCSKNTVCVKPGVCSKKGQRSVSKK
ncbi:MAG: hypothetical protein J6A01_08045 [Proteobacteria bacterium]|nr:hypothetical protein [Pseudomonadota bacterium]